MVIKARYTSVKYNLIILPFNHPGKIKFCSLELFGGRYIQY